MLKNLIKYTHLHSFVVRMAHTGLLVLTRPSVVGSLLPAIKEHVQNTLYVHVPYRHESSPSTDTLARIYSQTCIVDGVIDVRVLLESLKTPARGPIHTKREIAVVFFDRDCSDADVQSYVKSMTNVSSDCRVVNLSGIADVPGRGFVHSLENESEIPARKRYDNVVIGGTFDRLHSGHKILLSEAVLYCLKQLTVGVTDTSMLKSKNLWELIEPCAKRMDNVEDFLKDVDPSLEYKIVSISDPYGPTKEDPSFQAIVVSSETIKGGRMVNELRAKNELPLLDIKVVNLLESNEHPPEHFPDEAKISSSNYRLRLLGARLHTPEVKPNLPQWPYIIGLTGGIASGKSTMSRRMEHLGAGLINCDILAHKLYSKGEICHPLLVKNFGDHILDSQGEVDRKKLGAIVFQNKEKLELLNSILWPHILERAKLESELLYENGYRVVILEAAVLIRAGWHQHCHEVWSCIISPEVAMRRLATRNNLNASEAMARLSAQPTNLEFVANAHVVFCTEWNEDFSQYQAEKAWNGLQKFLQTGSQM